MERIGVIDTMFARYDMGGEALDALKQCPGHGTLFTTIRRRIGSAWGSSMPADNDQTLTARWSGRSR